MEKGLSTEDATPVNVRTSLTIEEALGISDTRFMHLGFIIDDIWTRKLTKAEALFFVANHKDLSDIEKTYLGFKIHERIAVLSLKNIPILGGLINRRLR
jgi:hypothetical protein